MSVFECPHVNKGVCMTVGCGTSGPDENFFYLSRYIFSGKKRRNRKKKQRKKVKSKKKKEK